MWRNMVCIGIKGTAAAEVITACLEKGWSIRNAHHQKEELVLEVALKDAVPFIHWVRAEQGTVRIVGKSGILWWWRKLLQRRGICLGVVFGISLVSLGLSYVWSYEVSGNEQLSDEEMIAIVQRYGGKIGTAKNNFDCEEAARQILKDYNSQLAWIWLDVEGTVLKIEVKEKENGEANMFLPADLVAEKAGIIENILVLQGTAQVQQGDAVEQGQVLIAGKEYDLWEKNAPGEFVPIGEERAVKARGVVSGIGSYSATGSCAFVEENVSKEKGRKRYLLKVGEYRILLGKEEKGEVLRETLWEKGMKIGEWELGAIGYWEYEATVQRREYSIQEAKEQAIARARAQLKSKIFDGEQLEERIALTVNQQMVQAEVEWKVKENLAVEVYE